MKTKKYRAFFNGELAVFFKGSQFVRKLEAEGFVVLSAIK
jgi:hypothetical protein